MLDLYCDGGVIGRNPSAKGGTWAWCHVDELGTRCLHASGHVTPKDVGMAVVTNNLTELLAAIQGMESLPSGWNGTIHTDSLITLYRILKKPHGKKPARMNGIPESMALRLIVVKRALGDYSVRLLFGHPTREQLVAGEREDGTPCSRHNVFCDVLCGEASRKFLRAEVKP